MYVGFRIAEMSRHKQIHTETGYAPPLKVVAKVVNLGVTIHLTHQDLRALLIS
jgi:hypothetical protein